MGLILLDNKSPVNTWPNKPREVLPPFPPITDSQPNGPYASCWAKQPYTIDLPSIPDKPKRTFFRGNPIGVRVPGLKEGDNDGFGGRTFDYTWYWVRYSESQMRLACDFHAIGCGYTHPSLSIPQTYNYGKTINDLARVMNYAHGHNMYVVMNVGSDGYPFETFREDLEKLLSLKALIPGRDILNSVWQIDKWYDEYAGIKFIIDCGTWATRHDLLNTVHWGGGYPGWADNCAMWNDETNSVWGINSRFSFQEFLGPLGLNVLHGHLGQCNTEEEIGQVQSWVSKIVQAFVPGMFFVAAEMDMQAQADDPANRLEVYGDLKAYLATCARPNYGIEISPWNGNRGLDGVVLR